METTVRTVDMTIDWDSIYVSVFPRISSRITPGATYTQRKLDYNESHKTPKEITLWQFLELAKDYLQEINAIRNEQDKDHRKYLKSTTLPAATICATFYTREGSVELRDRIKHYNSLVVIDLDNITDIEASRKAVQQLPYVLYCAASVSGNGLYAIIPIDNTDYTQHSTYVKALEKEFARIGLQADTACRDVTRLRILSYDPNPYINKECITYSLPEDTEQAPPLEKSSFTERDELHTQVDSCIKQWEERQISLDAYDEWTTMGMALSSLGESGREYFNRISRFSAKYNSGACDKKFDELLRTTRTLNIGTFFYKCRLKGISVPHRVLYNTAPFPAQVFPEKIRQIITETHRCLNFSIDHIGASLLFAASIACGNAINVEIKNEWIDKAILYIALVGYPGTNKSAPLRYAMRPLIDKDRAEYKKYRKAKDAYDSQMQKPLKERKAQLTEPEYIQTVLSDFTTEVLVRQHKINPRGLAVYVDELIGFIKCFNKYRSGNDEQMWTQLFTGSNIIVNRVSSEPINIDDTCIGVIGTIQPGLLNEFAKGKIDSGFIDRWLFAYPDKMMYPKLNHDEIPKDITNAWSDIIGKILKIPYKGKSKTLRLTKEAMNEYANWFDNLADQKNEGSPAFAAMATKIERYCIRFAIVLEIMKYGCGQSKLKSISLDSIEGAISLCHYFISCATKAHKQFSSSPLGELTEQQRRIYNELPISFNTGEGVEIAQDCGLGERAFKEWIKSKFFRHISHGKYEKRYK